MNRSDSVLSVYSDARAEYTKQLCVFLVPAYFQFFIDLLEKTKQEMANDPKKILWQFQNHLNAIHDWNMEKVNNEINHININCGCDYLEDLLTAVFIAHTKVLTAIRLSANNKKVDITIPKVEHFLFKVLCETSKLLWGSTYLFRDGISGIDKQQNYRTIESILNEGILQAIRSLVPVKSILRNFVNNDTNGDVDADADTNGNGNTKEDDDSDDEKEVKSEISIKKSDVVESVKPVVESVKPAVESVTSAMESVTSAVESVTSAPKEPASELKSIIKLNNKPTVQFSQFNSVFDSENSENTDMVLDTKEDEKEEDDGKSPVITISDEAPIEEFSFEDMINTPTESIGEDEFDEL